MTLKKTVFGLVAASVITTGVLFAQGFGPRAGHMDKKLEFAASYLDLTESQKQQAKQIVSDAMQSATPVLTELKSGHESMVSAVKAAKPDSELQRIAAAQGQLVGQLSFIHSKAWAQFWTILTPAQKAKAETLHDLIRDRMQARIGHFQQHQ
jgi:Spy/CpxP family protein refolding chaperone